MATGRNLTTIVPKRRAVAIALGLFLATLATVAPPVSAVEITQPEYRPGTISVTLHFEDPDVVPLTRVLLHFDCGVSGSIDDWHDLADGDDTAYAVLHVQAASNATTGYGYFQGTQTGYGYGVDGHGTHTGNTSVAQGADGGYGYGYGYASGDLVLVIDTHAAAFARGESCTVVVGIDAPGLAGDFESERSLPFQPRVPPIADAGDVQRRPENVTVHLDGFNSTDPDGKPGNLTYAWSQSDPASPAPALAGADTATPTFTSPSVSGDQDFTFRLTVNDTLDDDSDSVVVQVHHENRPPVADAGANQSAPEGAQVTLDGSNSTDPDGDELDYLWVKVSGPAGITLLDPTSKHPTFLVPGLALHDEDAVFRLAVTDGAAPTSSDDVAVHLEKRPLAALDPDTTEGPSPLTVHFEVTAACYTSSCETTVLDFGDGNATDAVADTVTHQYARPGLYHASLAVADTRGLVAEAQADIRAVDPGTPVAFAGPDQSVYVLATVRLDGRGSYDPDGQPLTTYAWTQVGGQHVTLQATADPAVKTFTAPSVGVDTELTFRLNVTDPQGLTDIDDVVVMVHPVSGAQEHEDYFFHVPDCIAAGQDPARVDQLSGEEPHVSHEDDGTGSPASTEFPDHLCVQPSQGLVEDPALLDGKHDFSSENQTDFEYRAGSTVDGTLRLALLLPDAVGPLPTDNTMVPVDDATLDVTLRAGTTVLGSKAGIPIDYSGVAFGLVPNLAAQTLMAGYVDVDFQFGVDGGTLPAHADFSVDVQVHSEAVNAYLEDGHDSGFRLTQAPPTANHVPTARTDGPIVVRSGERAILSGSAEDQDDSEFTFDWYQVGGPHVADLDDAGTDHLAFDAPDVDHQTVLRFALQVSDGQTTSAQPAETTVTVLPEQVVTPENQAPVASAGPDVAANEGSAVVLNGIAYDPDGEAVDVRWVQVVAAGDPAVAITPMPSADAALVAPQVTGDRLLTFSITATDPHGASRTDTMVLTVRDLSSPPSNPGGCNGCTSQPAVPSSNPVTVTSTGPSPTTTSAAPTTTTTKAPTGTDGFPLPAGGVLGFDLSASLRVTRVGDVNHLEWSGPGFQPLGYQVWSSNSPYVLLAINEGNRTTYDDAKGNGETLYKVTYFTGMTPEQGFFGDASQVFDWPQAQHQASAGKTGIPAVGAGLLGLALVGAAAMVAARRRLP